jgi:hypothetical protein
MVQVTAVTLAPEAVPLVALGPVCAGTIMMTMPTHIMAVAVMPMTVAMMPPPMPAPLATPIPAAVPVAPTAGSLCNFPCRQSQAQRDQSNP